MSITKGDYTPKNAKKQAPGAFLRRVPQRKMKNAPRLQPD